MRASAICCAVLTVTFAGSAVAKESPSFEMTWSDLVGRLDALPQLQEARFLARAAEAGVDAVGQVQNPEAEVRLGSGMPHEGQSDAFEWGVGLSLPFDWVGPRGAEVRAARSEADACRQDARLTRRSVLGRLAGLFWRIVFDQRLVATLEETESQVARLASMIRLRVEKGEARPPELPRIETELERVRIDLDRARADARSERRSLAVVMGLPDGVEPRVHAEPVGWPAPCGRDDAVRSVLAAHPRLAAAQSRIQARDAMVAAEKARRIPGFSLGGYFDRESDRDVAGGLLQVRLPVWNWNSGGIRRAEAQRQAETMAAEVALRDLVAETGEAWERCVQGRDSVSRFETEILPRAEAASRAVERGFELGEFSLIEVLDARRVLLDVRKEQIGTGLRARAECTALAVLTGGIEDVR